jgi:mannitol 2-dehydrogenase
VGGFNRSHLAVYLDDMLTLGEEKRWGESGVGLLPGDKQLHAGLAAQDFLYGLMLMDADQLSYRVIGSLTGHLYAPEATEAVFERLTAPECAIVSLTVTEGGYFIEDASGRVLLDHEDLRHDLEHPGAPKTWLGFVAEAAERRMKLGRAPFTLLSCDNVHGNGAIARKALLAFGEARSAALARWMETNIAFPNSMVDRITPRTTDENRAAIEEKFGVLDQVPVVSEPFRQWVIEDNFAAGRPAWERVGAQFTADVAPYEMTKMRLLNGGHSTLGYLADLLGHSFISEAAADPLLRQLLIEFMAEVKPTVPRLPGLDLDDYTATIVKRFSNTAIRDQVSRICSEGCAKVAKFLVPSLADLLNSGGTPRVLPLVIAGWLHYLRGYDETGRVMTMADAQIDSLEAFLGSGCKDARLALSVRSVFGDLLTAHPKIAGQIQGNLDKLRSHGVRATVTGVLEQIQTP